MLSICMPILKSNVMLFSILALNRMRIEPKVWLTALSLVAVRKFLPPRSMNMCESGRKSMCEFLWPTKFKWFQMITSYENEGYVDIDGRQCVSSSSILSIDGNQCVSSCNGQGFLNRNQTRCVSSCESEGFINVLGTQCVASCVLRSVDGSRSIDHSQVKNVAGTHGMAPCSTEGYLNINGTRCVSSCPILNIEGTQYVNSWLLDGCLNENGTQCVASCSIWIYTQLACE